MKRILEKVISYTGIAIVATSVGVIGGVLVASQEVEPAWYRTVVVAWPELDTAVRHEVASAMKDGRISRWESMALNERIVVRMLRYEAVDESDREQKEQLKKLVEAVK